MSDRPNVVWLTLESTRQDHTTMGDYRRDTTPNLARLADRDGWRAFDACFSHGIWTLSSTASILTGTVPSAHGTGMTNGALPDALATVPERLGEVGYHTECISPNPHLSPGTNLDRGFDEFTFVEKGSLLEAVGLRSLLRYGLNVRRHGGGFTLESRRHTPDFVMTDLAKRRLDDLAGGDPFFTYVHYAGPHRPYFPPRRFRERFGAEIDHSVERAGAVALDHHEHCWRYIAEGCPFSAAEWDSIEACYDGEIAHTDELVGDLVAHLEDLNAGRTVVVVTGDHGEYFGEEGLLGHNVGVHDAVSHVPLVIGEIGGPDESGPGVDGGCLAVDGDGLAVDDGGLVQHLDVVLTLLALAGADTGGIQGVDLRTDEREHAFVQRGPDRCRRRFRQLRELNPEFDTARYHSGTLTALRTPRFKYRHSEGRTELLELPDEETDVSGTYPDVRDRLDETVTEWLATVGRPRYTGRVEESFDDDMKSQLADLGYLVE